MWSNFISSKANNIYNSLFIKNEKNAILDPFSCMVRLAILNFKPKGTKISFYNFFSKHIFRNIFWGLSIHFLPSEVVIFSYNFHPSVPMLIFL